MASEEVEKPKDEKKPEEKIEEEIKIPTPNEKLDYKELYYSQPSQKDKVKKDFTEFTQIDMTLLNKKRERTVDENENNNKLNEDKNINNINEKEIKEKKEDIHIEKKEDLNNNDKEEEIKENDLENNLPKELLELIEERKGKEPFTAADFEKYKVFKKLNINFSK